MREGMPVWSQIHSMGASGLYGAHLIRQTIFGLSQKMDGLSFFMLPHDPTRPDPLDSRDTVRDIAGQLLTPYGDFFVSLERGYRKVAVFYSRESDQLASRKPNKLELYRRRAVGLLSARRLPRGFPDRPATARGEGTRLRRRLRAGLRLRGRGLAGDPRRAQTARRRREDGRRRAAQQTPDRRDHAARLRRWTNTTTNSAALFRATSISRREMVWDQTRGNHEAAARFSQQENQARREAQPHRRPGLAEVRPGRIHGAAQLRADAFHRPLQDALPGAGSADARRSPRARRSATTCSKCARWRCR